MRIVLICLFAFNGIYTDNIISLTKGHTLKLCKNIRVLSSPKRSGNKKQRCLILFSKTRPISLNKIPSVINQYKQGSKLIFEEIKL